jgi:hypothetical protein
MAVGNHITDILFSGTAVIYNTPVPMGTVQQRQFSSNRHLFKCLGKSPKANYKVSTSKERTKKKHIRKHETRQHV